MTKKGINLNCIIICIYYIFQNKNYRVRECTMKQHDVALKPIE